MTYLKLLGETRDIECRVVEGQRDHKIYQFDPSTSKGKGKERSVGHTGSQDFQGDQDLSTILHNTREMSPRVVGKYISQVTGTSKSVSNSTSKPQQLLKSPHILNHRLSQPLWDMHEFWPFGDHHSGGNKFWLNNFLEVLPCMRNGFHPFILS
ncbi:hypothetical protein Scep_001453 [Stephania cephalantha]|uniref:Uncharacterized protein n=1 Tax=Stephania cephalantha TaxID=152367 RepID=A0AAP0L9E8_9MAGN